ALKRSEGLAHAEPRALAWRLCPGSRRRNSQVRPSRLNAATGGGLIALLLVIVAVVGKAELDGGFLIGQYRAARIQFSDYQLANARPPVPCPRQAFVLLALGQSNAANQVGEPVSAVGDLPAYAFFHGRCFRIEDPIPGATGRDGSLWTHFAQRL